MNIREEEAIRCMQHCTSEWNIFFSKFPETCPICGKSLSRCQLIIPPFRLPSPFVSQRNVSCLFLVRPTRGSFLRDYKTGNDLHVGIAASNGVVYNFDERGLHADGTHWEQCIPVTISDSHFSRPEIWDSKLPEMLCNGMWTSMKYNEDNNNCYDFALSFLNQLLPSPSKPLTKPDFCETFILPKTTKAAYYIDLHRRVQQGCGVSVERSHR
ncbi:MKRN2 opposite strand protein-like [Montipora capricornis]|uniref:MKRN2 opposite strand protein-like n=1 Tax=Montipora capricornis TaxID=246305 RepID=UPI0035F208C2